MLVQEVADTFAQPSRFQVFASDIDDGALAIARQGLYPSTITGDVSPARLGRFFVPDQAGYRIKQEIRDRVLFARHNVLHDPPFSQLDAITCRNLLIYLNRDAQAQVLDAFHFGLRPHGYLLLGSAETVDGMHPLFTRTDLTQRLFQRRPGPPLTLKPVPGSSAPAQSAAVPPPRAPRRPITSFGELHTQLVAAYTPPSVIVDGDGTIVHLGRGVDHFLRFGEGAPSQNLLTVIQPDLRRDLRTAFTTARHAGQPAEARGVPVMVAGAARLIDVIVQPLTEPDWAEGYQLVVLQDVGAATTPPSPPTDTATLVPQLEADLEQSRAELRASVEQYEAVVEEYKAANEELQAINEELRAATEELETSKEELQSVNEELTTLNRELQHTVEEVSRAHNDLQNLIASTQIGTIFLDRALRVKRFTPAVQAIFNLLPADLGRPFAHVTHTLEGAGLTEDATVVLDTLTPLTREVQTTTGQWYLLRLLPYRTLDDRIDGVVLTFVDLTARKRVEEVLAERARLLDLSNDAIIVRDVNNRIVYWNHGAMELYGWTRDEALGQDQHTLLRTEFELPLADLIQTLQQRDRMEGEVVQVTRAGRRITVWSRWSLDRDRAGRPGAILTTYNDITARKQADANREQLLASEHAARAAAEAALHTRDQFLSIASHELRTPLTALLGYAYLLPQALTQGRGDPLKIATLTRRQAERLKTLIDQLLNVSRIQQGQFAITQEPVDLAALVREVVDAFRATQVPDLKHPVAVSAPAAPVMVVGDAERLEQVILNLLTNAVKYSPAGGPVRVQVTTTPTDAVLEVVDQGLGIPAAGQARVFDAFYRAANTGTHISGFGLGLHIVHEIVERHGGRVAVESVEGQGSTFRVVLPLGDPA